MAKQTKKKPLDAMVKVIYQAARRGVINKENASTTQNRIKHLVSQTDPQNKKLVEKAEAAIKRLADQDSELIVVRDDLKMANLFVEKSKEAISGIENLKAQIEDRDKRINELTSLNLTLTEENSKASILLKKAIDTEKELSELKLKISESTDKPKEAEDKAAEDKADKKK